MVLTVGQYLPVIRIQFLQKNIIKTWNVKGNGEKDETQNDNQFFELGSYIQLLSDDDGTIKGR